MKPAAINPRAFLAEHDIRAYLDTRAGDPVAVGRAALKEAGGDLLTAIQQNDALRAEIILAYLAAHGAAVDAVMRASLVLEDDV